MVVGGQIFQFGRALARTKECIRLFNLRKIDRGNSLQNIIPKSRPKRPQVLRLRSRCLTFDLRSSIFSQFLQHSDSLVLKLINLQVFCKTPASMHPPALAETSSRAPQALAKVSRATPAKSSLQSLSLPSQPHS